MVTKTITITEDAYNFLRSMKGSRSFSEVILGLRKKSDIMQYAGALKGIDLSSLREVRDDANRDWARRRRFNGTN